MHKLHNHENIKTCIITAVRIQDLIFSQERNIGTIFFSQYGLREATLYGISVSFLRETTIGVSYLHGNVNKKSESLRSLIKERTFKNLSATTRKSKQSLCKVRFVSLYLKRLWEICR